jgi:hypothetical protein
LAGRKEWIVKEYEKWVKDHWEPCGSEPEKTEPEDTIVRPIGVGDGCETLGVVFTAIDPAISEGPIIMGITLDEFVQMTGRHPDLPWNKPESL